MSLADELAAMPTGQATPAANLPAGWTPSVTYAPGGGADVVTLGLGQPGEDWRSDVEALGVAIPDGYRVRLVEVRHDPSAWVRHAQGEDATTESVTRRRYVVEPALVSPRDTTDELLAAIGKPRAKAAATAGEWAYVHALADMQIGKAAYGEGTEQTCARVLNALDRSVARLKAERKRRPVGTVVLAMLGDLCEGSASIGGAVLLQSDLGVTEQVRVVRRLLLEHVKAFAPLVDRLVIPTAPGNHDQPHRFGGIAPRAHDSWAVDVACQVADALAMAEGYDHVEVVCPDVDDLTVTIEAAGTVIGLAHGHQIKRGDGHGWWAKQGHARARIGSADLLLTGHYHHFRAETDGRRSWIQAPTVDPGSPWYDQRNGGRTAGGTLTLMTSGGAWSSLEIL
jgi:hypothetical protein